MRRLGWLLLFLLPVLCLGDVDTKDGTAITTSSTLDGESGIDTADGQAIVSGGSSTARLDAASTVQGNQATTLDFTVSAGTDRMLIACFGWEDTDPSSVTSVLYGDQSMVEMLSQNSGVAGTTAGVSVWYLLDSEITAASGTTIDPSYDDVNIADVQIHAISYEYVNQTGGGTTLTATNHAETNTTTPNPIVFDLTESSGGVVIACAVGGNAATMSWGADMTEQTDETDASSHSSLADRLSTTGANVDIEATTSNPIRMAGVSGAFATD